MKTIQALLIFFFFSGCSVKGVLNDISETLTGAWVREKENFVERMVFEADGAISFTRTAADGNIEIDREGRYFLYVTDTDVTANQQVVVINYADTDEKHYYLHLASSEISLVNEDSVFVLKREETTAQR